MFAAGTTGANEINEVVRDHLRLDTGFTGVWTIDTTTVNPSEIMFTSNNDGPHFITTESVTPASSGLLTGHFPICKYSSWCTTDYESNVSNINFNFSNRR